MPTADDARMGGEGLRERSMYIQCSWPAPPRLCGQGGEAWRANERGEVGTSTPLPSVGGLGLMLRSVLGEGFWAKGHMIATGDVDSGLCGTGLLYCERLGSGTWSGSCTVTMAEMGMPGRLLAAV